MDVLLTHGYFLHEDPVEKTIMRLYPPLGILYLSAYLKEHGLNVQVFDSTFSEFEVLQSKLLETKPAIIGIYANLMTKPSNIRIMKWIKSQPELRHSKIVLGGPDVTYNVENYLKHGADFLVIGEGEQTLLELSKAIINEQTYTGIHGIAYKKGNEVVINKPREKVKELDSLPVPDREAIDFRKYLKTWKQEHGYSSINISTQRGCPYTCKWCSTAVYGKSYRRRSPEKVADEIALLMDKFNPDSLWFVDDVFTINHKWINDLHAVFKSRNIFIPFEIITRAERLNENIMAKLKEMGCSKIWIGAESGSQRIIDEMDRRVKTDQVIDAMHLAKRYGIETGTFIMVGYPTETEEDIEMTVRYLKNADPDNFTITIAYPIKGTALYNQVKPLITTNLPWESSTDRDIDFKRTYSKSYYRHAIRYIVNEITAYKALNKTKPDYGKAFYSKTKSIFARTVMKLLR